MYNASVKVNHSKRQIFSEIYRKSILVGIIEWFNYYFILENIIPFYPVLLII